MPSFTAGYAWCVYSPSTSFLDFLSSSFVLSIDLVHVFHPSTFSGFTWWQTMDQIQQAVSTGYVTLELATVMVVLATISVIIRFVSKTFTRGRFSYDDYWIVFSLVAFWSYFGLLCGAVFGGGGGLGMPNLRKLDAAGVSFYVKVKEFLILVWEYRKINNAYKVLLISANVFVLGTATVQISILLYYRRIFTTQKFKRKTLGLGVIVALAWLVSELGIILQCFPLDSYWNPLVAGHCQNLNIFVMVMGLIDLLLDISILILPMSMIPELRLPLKHKISLSVIFLLGGLYVSATRASLMTSTNDLYKKRLHFSNCPSCTGLPSGSRKQYACLFPSAGLI